MNLDNYKKIFVNSVSRNAINAGNCINWMYKLNNPFAKEFDVYIEGWEDNKIWIHLHLFVMPDHYICGE